MGNARTHAKKRQRKRKILEAKGFSPERIERILAATRTRQAEKRVHERVVAPREAELQAAAEAATYERLTPDDRRHRPATGDSLTQGRARATGMTARAVKRTKAMTKWEYDELEAKGA